MYSCVHIIKRTYLSGHHTYIWNIPFSILVLYFQFWYTLYISFRYTLHIRIWLRIRIHALHMTAHIRHHLHIRIYTFIFGTRLIFRYISYFMFGYTLHIRYSLHVRHYLHIRRHTSYSDTHFTFGTFFVFNRLYIRILHIRIHECPIESLPLDHNPWGAVSKMADSVSVLRNELLDIIARLDTVEHWDFSDQVRDAIHRRLDQLSRN